MASGYRYSAIKIALARFLEFLFIPLTWPIPRPAKGTGDRVKILLLEPFCLGDASLLSVCLGPLKRHFPKGEIHLHIRHEYAEIFSRDPRVEAIQSFNWPWTKSNNKYNLFDYPYRSIVAFIRRLRAEHYDVGIDTRGEIRNQIIMVLAGCKRRVGFTNYLCSNATIGGWLLTDSLGRIPFKHRADVNLDLCRVLGVPDKVIESPCLWWPPDNTVSKRKKRILVHPGTSWARAQWPCENWGAIISRLHNRGDCEICVAGSEEDRAQMDGIHRLSGDAATFVVSSLSELCTAICYSDVVVCLDSGPMHLASVLNRPVLALFGPGALQQYAPFSEGSRVVQHQASFPCAPCSKTMCLYDDGNCIESISVDEVWSSLVDMISAEDASRDRLPSDCQPVSVERIPALV